MNKRDTYKYWFKVNNLKVHCGKTDNLQRRENEHINSRKYTIHNNKRYYWRYGHIVKVGQITTLSSALDWEHKNNCNKNWN